MSTEKRWAFMSRKVIGSEDNPMLVRWRLLQTPWFGIYLHFIHREDLDRWPHDHPWTFWTWVIRGSYHEELHRDVRVIGEESPVAIKTHYRRRWSFRRFPQTWAHRIIEVHGKVTTLVVVGRKNRTWGFYDLDGRFVDWRDYHAAHNGWTSAQERQREIYRRAAAQMKLGRP